MPTSSCETQYQTLLHLWNEGERNVKELHKITKIPTRTIYRNIKKLEESGTLEHAGGNGRPKKITADASRALGQYIRRDSSISTRTLAIKLSEIGVEASYRTVARHLNDMGYSKSLPKTTPMLTDSHKQKWVLWAQKHLNDNWEQTLFSDETAFQLFQNTVERWHKGARPVRHIPKDRTKIFAWGGFCINGKTSLFCFTRIMDAKFYVEILHDHIPEIEEMLGNVW